MNVTEFVNKITNSAAMYPNGTFSELNKIYTCINPYSYHLVRKNTELFDQMDGLFIDGISMCWWINFLWGNKVPRLSFDMSGMAMDFFNMLNQNSNKSVYFIGSKQEIIEKTIERFQESYPNINIKGFRNGYFLNIQDRINSINAILTNNSDYTIIGMGSPLQEQFAVDLKKAGYKGIVFTCGGFLHQSSKSINYYPTWINKYNLRAFYRLFHEKGLWSRLFNVLIQFPILFIWDSIISKIKDKTK